MSSTNSPCAACKFLRRKCTQECVFAPYFPPDQPQKFANVHKVFGASNVAKILNELNTTQREDAVNSLAYEADARLRDPVYGCVGLISILQHRLKQLQKDLHEAKMELASYIGPNVVPVLNQGFIPQIHGMQSSSVSVVPYNMQPAIGIAAPTNLYQQQEEMATVVDSIEQQEMLRNYEQEQQQPVDHVRNVASSGFNPMAAPVSMSPSLSLGNAYVNDMYQIPQQGQDKKPQLQPHHQFLVLQQETTQQPAVFCSSSAHKTASKEDRNVAPSS